MLEKLPYELLHNSFCKRILGVYKSTSNNLCRSEMGRHPLSIYVIMSVIKYWLYIIKLDNKRIVYHAYRNDLTFNTHRKSSWVTFIREILYKLNFSHVWETEQVTNEKLFIKSIKCKLLDVFGLEEHTNSQLYLGQNIPVKYRKAISKLRLRSNRLQIVRGKYTKIPRDERYCTFCLPKKIIEDEHHFILSCPKHKSRRAEMFKKIKDIDPTFEFLQDAEKVKYLLCPTSSTVSCAIGRYIHESFMYY